MTRQNPGFPGFFHALTAVLTYPWITSAGPADLFGGHQPVIDNPCFVMRLISSLFWNRRQQRLRCLWRVLIQGVGFVSIVIVLVMPMFMVLAALGSSGESEFALITAGTLHAVVLTVTLLTAWVLLDRRRLSELGVNLWSRRWLIEFVAGGLLGSSLMVGIFAIEYALGWIEIRRIAASGDLSGSSLGMHQLGWLVLMLMVGFSEEMFSRGYHLKNFSEGFRRFGVWQSTALAGLLSSAIFGLLHAFNPGATVLSTALVMMAGMMFAVGRVTTGSLAAPIGLHFTWNLFQGPILGFPVSGNQLQSSLVAIEQLGDPFWTGGEFGPESGLLGVLAMLIVIGVFLAWPKQHSVQRNVARLARYRRRKSQFR